MDPITLLFVSVGLAMDAFAVSLGIGTTRQANSPRPIFRISFHLGLFQGLMTFLGWLAGTSIARFIESIDHWVALALLGYVGFNMIRSGLRQDKDVQRDDPSRGKTLIMLSIACSLDAMAVGLGLAFLRVNILSTCLVIALVTILFSLFGLLGGNQLGVRFGKRMEIIGGLILTFIGLRILVSHLFHI